MDSVVYRFSRGDKDAFEMIYDKYWNKVYHFARLWLKDDYEVEEIIQETFIKLWELRGRIDPERNMDGLLFIIIRNLIFNRKRHSLNEELYKRYLTATEESLDDMQEKIEAKDTESYISNLVQLLPPQQKLTFLLSRRDGLSNAEIAKKLNISQRGVERNLYLAMRFIRKNLPLFIIFLRSPIYLQ